MAALAGGNSEDLFFVAVGGGSVIDTVKAAVVTAAHGGNTLDYQRAQGDREILSTLPGHTDHCWDRRRGVALCSYLRSQRSKKSGPGIAAALTAIRAAGSRTNPGLAAQVTAETGMDALTNAIEAYTSTDTDPFAQAIALKGAAMIGKWLRKAAAQPQNLEARSNMLVASMLGGLSFDYAGLGAVHACSHPLGAHFSLSHGLATALMLPAVMDFNRSACPELYKDIALALGADITGMDLFEAAGAAVRAVRNLIRDLEMPQSLRELGIPKGELPLLARESMQERANLCTNPRVPDEAQMIAIFQRAYAGEC